MSPQIKPEVITYNESHETANREICTFLAKAIQAGLPTAEHKVWHGAPVWFLNDNPVAGYSVLKNSVRLLFWSGQSFDEPDLLPEGSFKAAEVRYTNIKDIDPTKLQRWLVKSSTIQWDYKNIVKRKGRLERLTPTSEQ